VATTVISAFNEFLRDIVNLDSDETKTARNSRNWLIEQQIHKFPEKDDLFPNLYKEKDFYFGSFARRTKIRKLDDIDIMIALSAEGGHYNESQHHVEITVANDADKLKKLCFENSNILNSRKVINKFLSLLKDVPQYEKAEMKRNQEAATLKLSSHGWNFDLVPCFFTKEDSFGRTYYLIPDGQGNWKKTDPRIDRDRVSSINQNNDGNVLNVIRIFKYWNKRASMPTIPSYLLENIILNYYAKNTHSKASEFVDMEIPKILNDIHSSIHSPVMDPSGIQDDINTLSYDTRSKISERSLNDYYVAEEARKCENERNYKDSISKWRDIFGSEFPEYA